LERIQNEAVNTKVGGRTQTTDSKANLESDFAATQIELSKTRSQTEKTDAEHASQVKDLQAERESLISDLENARYQADDERLRADSMEAQIASLKSDIAAFGLVSGKTREEEPDIDVAPGQTEIAVVAMEVKSESSIETDTAKPNGQINAGIEEPIDTDVENVEEPKPEPILEYEADIDAEEIEPEPIPKVEVTEPLEVTAEEVQAAIHENASDKIIFKSALSDLASVDISVRIDAARVIGGIDNQLSVRVLVAHMADEPSAIVRQECIKALTTLEMKEGLSAVEHALADEAASVRLAAVWGLYRLAGRESIPALTRMLSDDDISVRRRAITCIGWVGGQIAKTGNHHCQQVISALIQCLNDPAESIQNATLDTLQTVTGKKISASGTSPERLIKQWQKWWQAELSE